MVDIKELEPIGGTISVVNVPVAMLTASNMPMRDCMAMAAMQGLMGRDWSYHKGTDAELITIWAQSAYFASDAMLKAREQK